MAEVLKVDQPKGINLLKEQVQLDPSIWQDAEDIKFQHGITKKVDGYEEGLGVSLVRPEIIIPLRDDDNLYYWWSYVGFVDPTPEDPDFAKFYQITSTVDHQDVTPEDGLYDPTLNGRSYRWTGDSINGVPYLTFGVPYIYDGVGTGAGGKFKIMENIPRFNVGLTPGDPGDVPLYPGDEDYDEELHANKGLPRVHFQTIRSYQNFMVGLNFDTSFYPGDFDYGMGGWDEGFHQNAIWWSHSVVGKNVDVGWKDAEPNQFSGWNFLGGSGGSVIDGKSLRDSFVIYRESSVWQMTYTGGVSVFAFKELFNDAGVLGLDCILEVEGEHIVVGQSDIYRHNGVTKKSIADGVLRRDMYDRIDPEHTGRVFITADYKNKEAWICIPEAGRTFEEGQEHLIGTCNIAYVYNWVEGTWSKKSVPNITSSVFTILSLSEENITWSATSEGGPFNENDPDYPDSPALNPDNPGVTWEQSSDNWSDSYFKYNPADWGIAMTSSDNSIYTGIKDQMKNGVNFTGKVEKTYLDMGDRLTTKYVSRVLPQVRKGAVDVYVAGTMTLEEGIKWGSPTRFDSTRDTHIAVRVNGRYIHVKYEIPPESRAEIKGWWLEWDYIGRR